MNGKAITAARKRAGLTQTALAELVDVQQGTVARWESNEISAPMHRLRKIAEATGVELAELVAPDPVLPGPANTPPPFGIREDARPFFDAPSSLPRDFPVLGSVLAADLAIEGDSVGVERMELGLADVIDHVRRPVGLFGKRDGYALYVQGYSMEPRFESGDLVFVDTRRPPAPGDDVVVQMRDGTGQDGDDQVVSAMIKRLVRRSAGGIELRQYSPDITFTLPIERVAAIHRVMRLAELLGT